MAHYRGLEDVRVIGDNETLQFLFESGTNEGYLFSFADYILSSVEVSMSHNVGAIPVWDESTFPAEMAPDPVRVDFGVVAPADKFIQEYSDDLVRYPLTRLVNPGHRTILEQLKALNTQIERRDR